MDTPNRGSQRSAIRVSDVERDQAVAELSEHYQAGRLTLEDSEVGACFRLTLPAASASRTPSPAPGSAAAA